MRNPTVRDCCSSYPGPVVTCVTRPVNQIDYTITNADTASLATTCSGATITSPISLNANGDATGTFTRVAGCSYVVSAQNACGTVTGQCPLLACGDINCTGLANCECVSYPSGAISTYPTFSVPITLNGIALGRTFNIAGEGTFTTPDIDVSGTYNGQFSYLDPLSGNCVGRVPGPFGHPIILHEQYLYTDGIGRDVFAFLALLPGVIVGSVVAIRDELTFVNPYEGRRMTLGISYPCTEFCVCPQGATISQAGYQSTTVDQAFDSSGITVQLSTVNF